MTHSEHGGANRTAADALAVLRLVFGDAFVRDFGVRLWDGTELPAERSAQFTFCVNHPGALRAAFARPIDLAAGRAFVAGLIDIDGDLETAIEAMLRATAALDVTRALRLMLLLRRLPRSPLPRLREAKLHGRRHSRMRDRAAIGFHYDQPVEFYRTFLGETMTYSCAYFDDGVESLDVAQTAKVDHVLRKVRLRRGERLLDIGCGWGGLVARAAAVFGAEAVGITLSRAQFDEASRRIEAEGSSARVRLCDYRDLRGETFDKIVSIGMFEHVGRSHLGAYFNSAYDALRSGGLFLNHGIANQDGASPDGTARGFVGRFIFPDGELVRLSEGLRQAEAAGFEVRDVENLREHYVRTLRAWVANLEHRRKEATAAADDRSVRAWRLYMAGSAQGFRIGRLGLYQTLLAKPDERGAVTIPATRRDLYQSSPGPNAR